MSAHVLYGVPASGGLSLALARAALYGWLLARREGGQFFLHLAGARTSRVRKAVLDELRFLGLDWDQEVEACPPRVWHAFGALPQAFPRYVPLPPVEGPEAGIEVRTWRAQGYSGLALANCVVRLGWSPRGKRSLLALDELAARFELGRVSRQPVRFDRRDLDWFNGRWLGGLDADQVTALLVPHWRAAYGCSERAEGTALSPFQWQERLALAIRDELYLPVQAVGKARFAFADELHLDDASRVALELPYAAQILDAFARELGTVEPFEFDPLDVFCRELRLRFKERLSIRSRDVMYVLRAALAGRQDGPCLVEVCQLLGPARCIERAQRAMLETRAAHPVSPP